MVNHEAPEGGVAAAKERIRDAALRVFAERGFDGARVDEIAKRAGVNKALIYYYYESKEKLLDAIFQGSVEEVLAELGPELHDTRIFEDEAAAVAIMERLLDFLEQRQDLLRIFLMESMKRSPVNDRIFILIAALLDRLFSLVDSQIARPEDMERARVMEFFTGLIPLFSYVVHHEIWMKAFGMDEARLRADFVRSFIDAHFTATEMLYKTNK
ncbi:MAG TPA: helix-turn-helix domain-containing protein [Spirochaetales bacterium]|nr:helix-turn-helix domain-containing protein [Spirochaetales bacterium]HRY54922.1 helix-turn-helix domain-containing protein [Spirochaetia bacterium]HRZ63509.1 helix-turn-helix domain-containing protein [Spirochaetia bacterium]